MYHQAGLLDCCLETIQATKKKAIRSGVVILSPYVFARQCDVKSLRCMDLELGSHEHL